MTRLLRLFDRVACVVLVGIVAGLVFYGLNVFWPVVEFPSVFAQKERKYTAEIPQLDYYEAPVECEPLVYDYDYDFPFDIFLIFNGETLIYCGE